MGVKKKVVNLQEDEYLVRRIAGRKVDEKTNKRYYLIEWEGYNLVENTWEEEHNIYSEAAVKTFLTELRKQKDPKDVQENQKLLLRNTYDPDTGLYSEPSKSKSKKSKSVKSTPPVSIVSTITTTNTTTTATVSNDVVNNTGSSVIIIEQATKKRSRESIETETESVNVSNPLKEARTGVEKLTLDNSTTFEEKMQLIRNSVKTNHPLVRAANHSYLNNAPVYQIKDLKSRVTVVNEVDSELPSNFIYVDELTYTDPVRPPDPDFLPGCQCSGRNCGHGCHDVIAYDKNGRLVIHQGTPIYECNQSCECDSTCNNRVVQKGRKIPLQVFKTKEKGWGVRTGQFIPKGTFIEEYIGEVIRVEEGDMRGAVYDKLGCSYLFDMDFAQSELPTKYVIDSYILGNVSRFFNHSCSPNLEVYAVFHDSADNQMHRLAFFAKRDIQKSEELCFDYNGRRDISENENPEDASRYSCHCDAPECRKWIYH